MKVLHKEKYIMTKEKKAIEFICSRCDKKKKSKNIAKAEVSGEVLCNSCFGELLSKKEIYK